MSWQSVLIGGAAALVVYVLLRWWRALLLSRSLPASERVVAAALLEGSEANRMILFVTADGGCYLREWPSVHGRLGRRWYVDNVWSSWSEDPR